MVTEDEIRRVAALMKIGIGDHKEHVDKVEAMIGYFGMLDSADVESEDIDFYEVPVSGLRADEHAAYGGDMSRTIKRHKGAFVRAPDMP